LVVSVAVALAAARLRCLPGVDAALSPEDAAVAVPLAPLRLFVPDAFRPSAGFAAGDDEADDDWDDCDDDEAPCDDSPESAAAVPQPKVTAAPIPSATASPPTRPTFAPAPITASLASVVHRPPEHQLAAA
jgi:hypothetical protein